jgi:hypothetical protein
VALGAYLIFALYLVYKGHLVLGDALSRVGNAYHVLYSRDPHLAAIGFVWSPLTSLAVMPLLPLKAFWPDLVRIGFAANISSAGFMAGAVYNVAAILRDIGVRRSLRIGLVVAFSLHPLIVYYAGNGMSEAGLVFFLLLACRYLLQWVENPNVLREVYLGFALAGAYLTRYEALPAALAIVLFVAIVSFARSEDEMVHRFVSMLCDALIVGSPFFLAVAVWAGSGWIVMGNPFEYISSAYGNSSFVRTGVATYGRQAMEIGVPGGLLGSLARAGLRILALEPLILPLMFLGVMQSVLQKSVRSVAVLAVFAPVLLFTLLAYVTGTIFPWLRVYITVIPLAVLLAGTLLAGPRASVSAKRSDQAASPVRRPIAAHAAALVAVMWAIPVAAIGMSNPLIARAEAAELGSVFTEHPTAYEARIARRFVTEGEVARYIDGFGLGRGTVLLSTFTGFPIEQASSRPEQFVTDSDRDFKQLLADPFGGGVKYLLVPEDSGMERLDAINRAYPGVYASGAGLGELVAEFVNVGDRPNWRLYRLTGEGG